MKNYIRIMIEFVCCNLQFLQQNNVLCVLQPSFSACNYLIIRGGGKPFKNIKSSCEETQSKNNMSDNENDLLLPATKRLLLAPFRSEKILKLSKT